ncbi:calcium-activated chloride channel regulator family member 3-like, partial [Saccoglossus kowalevskii]|uniref:Calcium-activated chloride channel regulator 1-like n=1 Tax=Saccoglossus kowalevskii TaxID=10224 RepID=A0ABM0LYM7_SACKO
MTSASSYLYNATHHRAYFRYITILVPEHWAPSEEYEVAGQESIQHADIHIDANSWPHVKSYKNCGRVGLGMYIGKNLFTKTGFSPYGQRDRVIVHEWGHYRWGVFDEYPTGNDAQFYYSSDGRLKPVACSTAVEVRQSDIRRKDGTTDDECVTDKSKCYYYINYSDQTATGSIMFMQFITS